jgi:tRNA(fMet)-specific endonuclease VapC
MMSNILVDSSVLINAQRNKLFFTELDNLREVLTISRVTACEVIMGSRDSKEKRQNMQLLEFLPITELDTDTAVLAFRLIDTLSLKTKLNISDAFIAATAIVNQQKLWTLNTKHFRRIPDLKLYNE